MAERDRHKSWALLQQLHLNSSFPWFCVGDFNEVLVVDEHEGRDLRSNRQMENFRNALRNCPLIDMGFIGHKFTWETTREGGIEVRLDRAVANQKWLDLFPNFKVVHLNATSSDHLPVLVDWWGRKKEWHKKLFRYEEGLSVKKGCIEMVGSAWSKECNGSLMFQVTEKIKATRLQLMQWVKNSEREIKATEDKSNSLFGQPFTGTTIAQRQELYTKLPSLLAQEEAFWKQRSKENWLKLGDSNTRFFHQKATHRQWVNCLSGLFYESGAWHEDKAGMEKLLWIIFRTCLTLRG